LDGTIGSRHAVAMGTTAMTGMSGPMLMGTVAALCTTTAFLPQLFKIRKQGSTELSTAMLAMYLAGLCLWLVYGLMIGAVPVIAANAVSIVIVCAVTFRKVAAARASGAGRRRLRIAVDMDEVMADALTEHLRRYNATFGAQFAIGHLCGRRLEDCVPFSQRETVEAMLDASFFTDLAVMPDCEEVIRELAARHDVFIVTAAMDVPSSFDAKFRWLRRHFPFIPPAQIVFCGDKSICEADYLIDDCPRHFAGFKGRPLLFSAPHNAGESRYPRVDSWKAVREVFARLDGESSRPTWVPAVDREERAVETPAPAQ
jgi:5'-nucleotidase